jgi:glucan 1,3-beta-glucosidase
MSDFMLVIKSASPGLVLLEINMAGTKPGDVGFFNVHFPLNMGGTITKPRTCSSAANCPSNHISVHMTPSSSVYWENTWVSDAGGRQSRTSNGGGFFVESRGGTWINGIGSGQSPPPEERRYPVRESSLWSVQAMIQAANNNVEHSAMYQVSIHNAKGVFIGVQQAESAYWQVQTQASVLNPGSWSSGLFAGEPNFGWCGTRDSAVCSFLNDFICHILTRSLQYLGVKIQGANCIPLFLVPCWSLSVRNRL